MKIMQISLSVAIYIAVWLIFIGSIEPTQLKRQRKYAVFISSLFLFYFIKAFYSDLLGTPLFKYSMQNKLQQFSNRLNNYNMHLHCHSMPCTLHIILEFVIHWNCKCIIIESKCHTPKWKHSHTNTNFDGRKKSDSL